MNQNRGVRDKFAVVVVAIVGFGLTVFNAIEYSNASVSSSWPTTIGKVNYSKLVKKRIDSGSEFSYEAAIRYTYKVKGKSYKSNRVYFGESLQITSDDFPKKLLKRFPLGSTPTVYFNPSRPTSAVLIPGSNSKIQTSLIIGILMLVGGTLAFIYLVKRENSEF